MKLSIILSALFSLMIISCNKHNSSEVIMCKAVLVYDSYSSTLIDAKFKYDSLSIERNREDSMTITRYLPEGYYYTTFSLKNDVFYENRIVPHEIMERETETSIILIPIFSKMDTAFNYTPPEEDFTSFFVRDLSFDNCNYQIEKTSNGFLSIKKSLIDTAYKEIFFYDENYNICKFINTWKNNKCVYVKKE